MMGAGGREEISMVTEEGTRNHTGGKEDNFWKVPLPSECMHFVDSPDSDSFSCLVFALERATVIAVDAEWKPLLHGSGRASAGKLPRVSILQIACRLHDEPRGEEGDNTIEKGVRCGLTALERHNATGKETETCTEMIFLLDLLAIPASAFSKVLKKVFVDPAVLQLGFGFKQDLLRLRGTFPGPDAHCCFDQVEPYLDVGKLYRHLHTNKSTFISPGRRIMNGGEYSLTTISEQILGLPINKDMQCSNWEERPLTSRQFDYAVADAYSLLFWRFFMLSNWKLRSLGLLQRTVGDDNTDALWNGCKAGLAELLAPEGAVLFGIADNYASSICQPKRGDATAMVEPALGEAGFSGLRRDVANLPRLKPNVTLGKTLSITALVHRFGETLLMTEAQAVTSNRSKRKTRTRRGEDDGKSRELQDEEDLMYVGPPPWDDAVGGDGIPKFLCDAMVEGLARQLRSVGIDAASPNSRKCEPRELVDLAEKEGRIILTCDAQLLRRKLVPSELAYRVKRQGKWDQLAEIIETFKLTISEDQPRTRCTKCNGCFLPKALTAKEVAAEGP